MITLSNDFLTLTLDSKGAELTGISDPRTGTSYLWNAEPSVWGRHAPVLFPIVGKLRNNEYTSGGKKYQLPQHGFARDQVFKIKEQTRDKIVFLLVSDSHTLEKYPYEFELEIEYRLSGKEVQVLYRVNNIQKTDIYFSIGAHPGFTCPVRTGERYEDYYLEFEKPETLALHVLKDGLISSETQSYLNNGQKIPLSYALFAQDALVFRDYQSSYISLKHKDKGEIFKFHFAGYPFLGIWSKPGPFVCIEPWYGIADFVEHNGILEEKTGIQKLAAGQVFDCKWSVEFTEL
jgi:galactose mutarotase-like enzyme